MGDTDWTAEESLFAAESSYAESIVRSAIGDHEASIASLRVALEVLPTYAPAILALGSIDYQLGRVEEGCSRLLSLVDLPDDTADLAEIIDAAGDFLIGERDYRHGLELYERAVARFPELVVLYQGVSCCAGHVGQPELAVTACEEASRRAPDDQQVRNDLGWSLVEAGRLEEALAHLQVAVRMDPDDALAAENLRWCREALGEQP